MAQLYLKDSFRMLHQGLTETEYQTEPFWSWNPAYHAIANSSQTFPASWAETCYLYLNNIGEFFRCELGNHQILVGAKSIMADWTDCDIAMSRYCDMNQLCKNKLWDVLVSRITSARDDGAITSAQRTAIFQSALQYMS